MNASQPDNSELKREVGIAFRQAWAEVLAEDRETPDMELLAAYAEGRLSDREARSVEQQIQQSPAACEIAETLLEQRQRQANVVRFAPPKTGVSTRVSASVKSGWQLISSRAWPLATAATLLIAMTLGLFVWKMRNDVNALRGRVAQVNLLASRVSGLQQSMQSSATELVRAEKEHLAQLSAAYQPVFLSGTTSPELLRVSLSGLQRGRSVGPIPPEHVKHLQAAERNLDLAIKQLASIAPDENSVAIQREKAAALVAAGNLGAADEELQSIERMEEHPSPTTKNLRASWLAVKSESLPSTEAKALLAQAEALFRQAAEGGVTEAWLNLGNLLFEHDRPEEARQAIQDYLRLEPNDERREIVRGALGK